MRSTGALLTAAGMVPLISSASPLHEIRFQQFVPIDVPRWEHRTEATAFPPSSREAAFN
jgi:hypothetical protein